MRKKRTLASILIIVVIVIAVIAAVKIVKQPKGQEESNNPDSNMQNAFNLSDSTDGDLIEAEIDFNNEEETNTLIIETQEETKIKQTLQRKEDSVPPWKEEWTGTEDLEIDLN